MNTYVPFAFLVYNMAILWSLLRFTKEENIDDKIWIVFVYLVLVAIPFGLGYFAHP